MSPPIDRAVIRRHVVFSVLSYWLASSSTADRPRYWRSAVPTDT